MHNNKHFPMCMNPMICSCGPNCSAGGRYGNRKRSLMSPLLSRFAAVGFARGQNQQGQTGRRTKGRGFYSQREIQTVSPSRSPPFSLREQTGTLCILTQMPQTEKLVCACIIIHSFVNNENKLTKLQIWFPAQSPRHITFDHHVWSNVIPSAIHATE